MEEYRVVIIDRHDRSPTFDVKLGTEFVEGFDSEQVAKDFAQAMNSARKARIEEEQKRLMGL